MTPCQDGARVPTAQPVWAPRRVGVPVASFWVRQGGGVIAASSAVREPVAPVKKDEEAPTPAIANARNRLLYYLVHGGDTSSSHTRTTTNKAASEEERRDRHNMARHSALVTSDVAPDWVCVDPDLVLAWSKDRSRPTAQTSSGLRCRIIDQLYKIGLAKSKCAAHALAGKGKDGWCGPESAPDRRRVPDMVNRLCEAERLRRDHATSADQGCRNPGRPFVIGRMMAITTTR